MEVSVAEYNHLYTGLKTFSWAVVACRHQRTRLLCRNCALTVRQVQRYVECHVLLLDVYLLRPKLEKTGCPTHCSMNSCVSQCARALAAPMLLLQS